MRTESWTPASLALLQKLWTEGETAAGIAEKLGGVSRAAVLGKIFRLRRNTSGGAKVTAAATLPADRSRRYGASPVPLPPLPRRRGAKPLDAAATIARGKGKTLLELTNGCCRWPYRRPGTSKFFFCGEPGADLEQGIPYCARHMKRAYVAAPALPPKAGRAWPPA
jgi:GcrA cell cycle regulator